MHQSVIGLTPEQAAKQWVAYVSDTMQLLVMHGLDPQLTEPLLDAHIKHVASWLLCLYFFNTEGEGLAVLRTHVAAPRGIGGMRCL
jgi:hypothetical protein